MRCPFCTKDNDSVRDTRLIDDGSAIRRRRVCNHCKRKFTTFERVEATLLVRKKDGTFENFIREKIEMGLARACWKRPVSPELLASLVQTAENRILDEFEREVGTGDIGNIVMELLATVDQIAYVRFASVYREFTTAQDFVRELRPILKQGN